MSCIVRLRQASTVHRFDLLLGVPAGIQRHADKSQNYRQHKKSQDRLHC
jgi:hypothetical protein